MGHEAREVGLSIGGLGSQAEVMLEKREMPKPLQGTKSPSMMAEIRADESTMKQLAHYLDTIPDRCGKTPHRAITRREARI
jgi:hypothetical protein